MLNYSLSEKNLSYCDFLLVKELLIICSPISRIINYALFFLHVLILLFKNIIRRTFLMNCENEYIYILNK